MNIGLEMFMHIHNVKHQGHHDHSKCQICQQLLISSKKAIIPPATLIQKIQPFLGYAIFIIQKVVSGFEFQSFFTRGPPAVFINS